MIFLYKQLINLEQVSFRLVRFIFDTPIGLLLFNTDNYNRMGNKTKHEKPT